MPSAASYTNRLRFNTEARNTKIQYPGGVSNTFRANLPAMCTDFNTTVSTNDNTITTIAGTGTAGYNGDEQQATNARLNYPLGVAVDSGGNLFIADSDNSRIRKVVLSTGIISNVAGSGVLGYSGDEGSAINAQLNTPYGVALDSIGNVYIADTDNHCIRKVTLGGIISTIAGIGTAGYNGDEQPATNAQLSFPLGVAVDSYGNIFIADAFNYRIRKVSGGIISTIAGTGTAGYNGDGGTAINAQLNKPHDVALDSIGNVYIADGYNHCIRKVSGGIISTIAGTGTAGYNGDGGPAINAMLKYPYGVAVDSSGNLFIADTINRCIRKVTLGGIISTIAGTGTAGYNGDGGTAINAQLGGPRDVAVDSIGNVYIADSGNHRIRKLTPVSKTVYNPPWFAPLDFSKPCRCNSGKPITSVVCPACSVQTTTYIHAEAPGAECVTLDGNSGTILDGN